MTKLVGKDWASSLKEDPVAYVSHHPNGRWGGCVYFKGFIVANYTCRFRWQACRKARKALRIAQNPRKEKITITL